MKLDLLLKKRAQLRGASPYSALSLDRSSPLLHLFMLRLTLTLTLLPCIAVDFSFDLSYRPVGPSRLSPTNPIPDHTRCEALTNSVTLGRSGLTIGITFRAKTITKGYYKCCDEICISAWSIKEKSK